MNSYVFIGTEKDLLDNGFVYRPHYDNFCSVYRKKIGKQTKIIEIDSKTKKVNIYIHSKRA